MHSSGDFILFITKLNHQIGSSLAQREGRRQSKREIVTEFESSSLDNCERASERAGALYECVLLWSSTAFIVDFHSFQQTPLCCVVLHFFLFLDQFFYCTFPYIHSIVTYRLLLLLLRQWYCWCWCCCEYSQNKCRSRTTKIDMNA